MNKENTKQENKKGAWATRIVGGVLLLGIAVFVIGGLWLAYHPKEPALQGMVEATRLDVAPKISGRVLKVLVREGDSVKAGQVLAELETPELNAKLLQADAAMKAAEAKQAMVDTGARVEEKAAVKANWQRAVAAEELAGKTYQRLESLEKEGLVSVQRRDEAWANWQGAKEAVLALKAQVDMLDAGARVEEKAAAVALAKQAGGGRAEVESLLKDRELKAPADAEVETVVLRAGELAGAGFPMFALVDLSDAWMSVNVKETVLGRFSMGGEFAGKVPALNGKIVKWKIYYISPRGDFAVWKPTRQQGGFDVRTFEVRARPLEKVEGLRPGMSVILED